MNRLKTSPRKLRMNSLRGLVFTTALLLVTGSQALGSVLVAPTVIIMSDKNRTGRMILQNPTDKPKEIEVRFSYGLPVSDSLGNIQVRLNDSTVTDPRCAKDWLRAFPRKMVLQPGASQTVRFVARPPKNLEDGEYWARVVVRSQEANRDIPEAREGTITTNLNMIMQTAISLKYRSGKVFSDLEVVDATAEVVDSTVVLVMDLSNRGNVSYLGMLNCRLIDDEGKEISSQRIDIAVYYDMRRRFDLPLREGNFRKPYHVEFNISNKGRTDISPEDVIAGKDVNYSMVVD